MIYKGDDEHELFPKILKSGLTCPFKIFEVEKITSQNGFLIGFFKNFAQYKFHSWVWGTIAFTIVLPKKTIMNMDSNQVRKQLGL